MMGRTHVVTGISAASWTAVPLAAMGVVPGLCLLSIPVGAWATLLPDIDHEHSRITYCLPPLSNITSWVIRGCPIGWTIPPVVVPLFGWVLYRGWEFRARLAPWHVRHRYELHTKTAAVIFGLVLGLPLWLVHGIGTQWWAFALQIMVGCLTHRWGDMRTTGGLPVHGEWKTIGIPFDVGSDYEHWLRTTIYRYAAILSVIGALLLIGALA